MVSPDISVMPYFLVNVLAGLTKVNLTTFAWTTALGSVPGILIYCYARQQLLTIKSTDQILKSKFIIAFALLSGFTILAVVVRWALINRKN